jgi:2'-5' RNA ligase
VIVAIPEAEAAVAALRLRLDPAAAWGVPAHVTVLYPFLPPDEIDGRALAGVASAVGTVPAFDVRFERTAWFGDEVLWLAPEPSEPLRELTTQVWQRFPGCAPYEGAHAELIPHLTVGDHAAMTALREADLTVSAALPVQARVTHARLICGSPEPNSWRTMTEFPLG